MSIRKIIKPYDLKSEGLWSSLTSEKVHAENEYSFKNCYLILFKYVVMFMGSFLRFQASRPGHFKELGCYKHLRISLIVIGDNNSSSGHGRRRCTIKSAQ